MENDESTSLLGPEKKTEKGKVSFVRGGIPCGIIIVLYFLSFYMYVTWLAQYVEQRIHQSYFNSTNTTDHNVDVCFRNETDNNTLLETQIQQEASEKIMYFTYVTSFPSLLVNLVMGSYSDSIGRKKFFLIPIFGNVAKGIVTLLVVKLDLNLNYMFLAFGMDGIGGSFPTLLLASFAYTADITPPKNMRTLAIASMEVALAVGVIFGKLATGFLISLTGFFYPMILSTGLSSLSILTVILFLPETIDTKQSADKSPVTHLKNAFGFYLFFGSCRRRRQYIVVILIFCLGLVARFGRDNTETLYFLDHPFCWNSETIGYFGALRTGLTSIGTILFIKVCLSCSFRDEYVIATGMVSEIGGLILEAMASNDIMLWMTTLASNIEPTSSPITRSMLSRLTSPSQQGALFASIATLESVTYLIANTMYGSIYSVTVGSMKGAVFLIMSVWPLLAICVCIVHVIMAKEGTVTLEINIQEDSKKQDISC